MPLPNILLIIIDDLPDKMLETMPFTRANIEDLGANFINGTITTPLCAASRTTLLTGKLAHDHGVWANTGPYGGWDALKQHEATALPTVMQAAGYRTGLFGKYMNGWNKDWAVNHVVPPGWHKFAAIIPDGGGDGSYYNYTLVGTNPDEYHAKAEADYSTDVVSDKAANFIANTNETTPFFCWYAPYGTHAGFQPAPRHQGTYQSGPLNPAVNSDNSLRAPWLRNLPLVDEAKILSIYQEQFECVMSIDEGIASLFAAIGPARLANTLILFTGDNGLQRGEQRLMGKNLPYPASTNVTMLGRWDGHITPNSKPLGITTNADFVRTVLDAAGTNMPGTDGVFVGSRDSGHLIEGMADVDDSTPGWIGWKTRNWLYVNYGAGQGEELYKIICDRDALTNVASSFPDKVVELRNKTIAGCQPLPPAFVL
jgi:N-acetylglucosamine-6-sulfatase